MRPSITLPIYIIIIFVSSACSEEKTSKKDVITNYANIVHQSYTDAYNATIAMQKSIDSFLMQPTESGFKNVKTSWLKAREIYGQTEVYRETNSPVDIAYSELTPWGIANEGQMNAWPIDESYIDYAADGTQGYAGLYTSIIADSTIVISEKTLAELNEKDSDKSISTGWHAVEFLLWGQDNTLPEDDKPGMRSYTDYTTAANAERRKRYLEVVTQLLVSDLKKLVDTWSLDGMYRKVFETLDEDTAITQLINGAFFLVGDELSSERMIAPVDSTDGIDGSGQEDEHSCFSDNTHRDIYANMLGVKNVIFGTYNSISGTSFYDLVLQEDKNQATLLKQAVDEAMTSVKVIADHPYPFDVLITKESSADIEFGPVMQSVEALQKLGDQISVSASSIQISLR